MIGRGNGHENRDGGADVGERGGVIVLVGAVLLLFGTFLPWTRATGTLAYATKDGVDGDTGAVLLMLAVVIGLVAALTLLTSAPSRVAAIAVAVGGVVSAGISIYEMFQVDDTFDDVFGPAGGDFDDLDARVGVGLYLCLLASAIVVLGAVLAMRQADRVDRTA